MITPKISKAWVLIFVIGLCFACTTITSPKDTTKKKVLAQVYNKQLLASDLEDLLPESYKQEDSSMIYNAYVENWLRDAVLMHEAEQKIPQNLDIDKLVKDYRSTLILHNYEEIIVETQLDSVISDAELNAFYEANKNSYQLKNPLIRVKFIKVPVTANETDQIDIWLASQNKTDRLKLIEYCNTYAEEYYLNEREWYEIPKIKRLIPTNLFPNSTFTQIGLDIKRKDDQYKYYLRVLDIIQKNEAPPIDYIEEKARQIILQRRKAMLLEDHREKLYEKEISNVKVYTQ